MPRIHKKHRYCSEERQLIEMAKETCSTDMITAKKHFLVEQQFQTTQVKP